MYLLLLWRSAIVIFLSWQINQGKSILCCAFYLNAHSYSWLVLTLHSAPQTYLSKRLNICGIISCCHLPQIGFKKSHFIFSFKMLFEATASIPTHIPYDKLSYFSIYPFHHHLPRETHLPNGHLKVLSWDSILHIHICTWLRIIWNIDQG